jgi:serralysin
MSNLVSTQTTTVITYPYSGDYRIDVLLPSDTARWNNGNPVGSSVTVSYSFMIAVPSYAKESDRTDFSVFTPEQKTAIRQILTLISEQIGISFQEVADRGSSYGIMRFGNNAQGQTSAGYATYPNTNDRNLAGDVFINNRLAENLSNIVPGTGGWATLVHEIGHALGLKHPGNYNADEAPSTQADNYLAAAEDTKAVSIMSYIDTPQYQTREFFGVNDLLALKYLYGGLPYNESDTTYTFNDMARHALTMINDTGGVDTIDVSAATVGASIDLTPGVASSIGELADGTISLNNLSLAYDAVIENVIGTAFNDFIKGNSADNTFTSGTGHDTIDGAGGTDTAVFTRALSNYTRGKGFGFVVQANGNANDTSILTNVERLRFSDAQLAIDMEATQSGGEAALLIGAVLGKTSLADKGMVGLLLPYFDSGAKILDVANLLVSSGIMNQLAGGSSTSAYVALIYHAVTGQSATDQVIAGLAPYIDSGSYTKAGFLVAVAELPLNQANVDLVGLQQTGIEYF